VTKVFGEPPKFIDDYDFLQNTPPSPFRTPMLGAFTEVNLNPKP
jgi:hypothetical protein